MQRTGVLFLIDKQFSVHENVDKIPLYVRNRNENDKKRFDFLRVKMYK